MLRRISATLLGLTVLFGLASPAAAVNKTVNGITLDINMPQAQRGVPYSFQLAPTGGSGGYTFSIIGGALPVAFRMSSSGLVTGVNCISTNGTYNVDVRIVSNGVTADFVSNQAVSINMTAGPADSCALTLGASTPSNGGNPKVGEYYSATMATPTGGTGPYTFAVASGALPTGLSLNSTTGTISGTPSAAGTFAYSLRASDSTGKSGYLEYSLTVDPADAISLSPTSLTAPVTGTPYLQTLTASGGSAPYSFAVTSGALPTGLSLNGATGAISGTPTAAGAYSFTVRATDADTATGTRSYSVTVSPAVAITTASLPAPTAGQAYSQTVATSGGRAPVSFQVSAGSLPAGLSLNAATGAITGTPTTTGAYSFTILATDADAATASRGYAGTVASSLAIATAVLPTPLIGQAYSQSVSASGGSAPVTYSVSSGALPAGLSLDPSTGAISGTPTMAGPYSFTIQATDASTATASQSYSGTIAAALAITTATLPTPLIGQAYSQTVATSGGTPSVGFTVAAGALPASLSLDAATGAITGTPSAAGAYSFTIQASDANHVTASQAYSGTVVAALAVTAGALPTPLLGQAYSQTVTTSGGTAPVGFSVSAGALPAGLSLNAATGAITGTPSAAGAYSFTIQASDANHVTDAKTYSGTINAVLAISSGALPTPLVGQAYSQAVTTSGGTGPIAFAISGGALPMGLSLDPATGVIGGTPTAAGAYSFTVQAKDANDVTVSQSHSGTIAAQITIATATLPTPLIGQTYSQVIATSGGTGAITFAISAGALPAGLSLNAANGAVTGVATTAGPYAFTVKATDANHVAANQAYSGTVVALPTVTALTVEVPYDSAGAEIMLAASEAGASLSLAAGPAHGTVTLAGYVATYAPTAGYIGPDSFSYTATGAGGASSAATVSITVLPPPPPTTESPPDQTLSTDGQDANSTSTTTVDVATIDLSRLVKGLATEVRVVEPPKNGSVVLEAVRSAAAPVEGATKKTGSARAAGSSFMAVYTPNKGFLGRDSFSFVAVGPGGTSAPAFVNIEVVARAPTAKPISVASVEGRRVVVSLTGEGGPFTAGTLVSAPADSVGRTQLIEGGLAGDRTYTLQFDPNPAFGGVAVITYTLANATGVSAPLTVSITVTPRANPALDPEVRGLAQAETETARRFAGAQLDNFRDRLEQVRRGARGGAGVRLVSGVNEIEDPVAMQRRMRGPQEETRPTPAAAEAPHAAAPPTGPRRVGEIAVWSGGAVSIGERDARSGQAKLTVSTSGLSAGADMMLSEALTVGVGGGFGDERTKVGSQGSRLEARTWALSVYGSWRPAPGAFVDAVLGGGGMDFDIRRHVTASGAYATGERDGDLAFGSLAAGLDRSGGDLRWSTYGRAEAIRASLGDYVETGAGLYDLHYSRRDIESLAGVLGGRIEFDRKLTSGLLTPRLRAEVRHEFLDVDAQTLHYADWLQGPGYAVSADGWARDRVSLGVGAGLMLQNGWTFDLDVSGEFGDDHQFGTAKVGAGRRF